MGSVIERALALAIRHLALLAGTALVVIAVPMTIGEYLMLSAQTSQFQTLVQAFSRLGTSSQLPTIPVEAFSQMHTLIAGEVVLCVGLLLTPFATNAIAVNVADLLAGAQAGFASGLGRAFARTPQILGVLFFAFVVDIGAIVAFAIAIVAMVFGIVAVYQFLSHSVVLLSALITLALFAVAAMFVALMLVGVALTFAGFATVIDRNGVLASLALGFERVFKRGEWKRALGIALVGVVVALFVGSVAGTAEIVFLFVPWGAAIAAVIYAITVAVGMALQTALYAVYYLELRQRELAAA